MRILVLWAGDINPNLGVRALARGSRDLLSRVWPDAEFTYADFGQRPPQLPWGRVGSLAKERVTGRLGMQRYLRGFDLIWDTRSGDSFSDIYGLRRLAVMSSVHEYARQAGTPVVMAPQTIGPFRTRTGRIIARRTLRRSNLVFARDHLSAAASASLGRPVDATVTDLVFGIDQATPGPVRDVLLNVSGLLWQKNSHVDFEIYRTSVRKVIVGLLERGRHVTLLPHVLDSPNHDNDVPVARQLGEEFAGAVDVVVPNGLDEARSVITSSALLVGARMHACLNALSAGVPAIAMAYSRKFEPLLEALEWHEVVSLADDQDVAGRVLESCEDPHIGSRARQSQRRAQELLAGAVPLLERLH